MSVVIIGGHDRMASEYKKICEQYHCKAKVFTQMPGDLKKQIGIPDLLVLFTSTVSHKMVISAAKEAKRNDIPTVRLHTSSKAALIQMLEEFMKTA